MNEHDNKLKELAELLAASEEKRHHDLVQQQNVIEAMAADLHRIRRQRDGLEQAIVAIEAKAVHLKSDVDKTSLDDIRLAFEWIAATCRDARV